MEFEGKEKRVYHGIWIPFLLIILVPTICYIGFYLCFSRFTDHSQDIVIKMSLGFSGLIGVLFCLICLISGFIHDLFVAMINRIRDVFEYFKPFSKEANRWYFEQFKQDGGIIIWIFFLLLFSFLAISIYGFTAFFSWYNSQLVVLH